jgi:uncharacterized protein (TIGR00251 family)
VTTLRVQVKPNAREAGLEQRPDGTWLARVKAPPVDGKANAELIALLAAHFHVAKSRVSVKSGAGGRLKLITIE